MIKRNELRRCCKFEGKIPLSGQEPMIFIMSVNSKLSDFADFCGLEEQLPELHTLDHD